MGIPHRCDGLYIYDIELTMDGQIRTTYKCRECPKTFVGLIKPVVSISPGTGDGHANQTDSAKRR